MKKFTAYFMVREDGELNTKEESFETKNKTAAIRYAKEIAMQRGWRFFSLRETT